MDKQEKGFAFRGLEIHSSRMFDYAQVLRNLDFMQRYGLNTLIFHKNELLDNAVFPEKYYSMEYMWRRFGPRYSKTLNNRYYLNTVIEECHRRGIRFMAEVKEIGFDEWITELHPEVICEQTHRLCPSHPFWWEYLAAKMEEFLREIPDIDGVIVSPGTRESKLSISANRCGCARCEATEDAAWYAQLLQVMYEKLAAQGKYLAVRDFAFTSGDQTVILEGARRVSPQIILALKNTPHDYFPTFPTNDAIGRSGQREWVEFDCWGQFVGNGVFPVSLVEDLQQRMQECRARGVAGIWLRTDWENMDDHCAFNSPNLLNVVAGAMLAQNPDAAIDDIYREWARYGLLSPLKTASAIEEPIPVTRPGAWEKLRDFMLASWRVMEKTVFVRGLVFQDNSMFPYTMERCFGIMLKILSRSDWDPGADEKVAPTLENLAVIFEEKRQAVAESDALADILQVETLGLPTEMAEDLRDMLELYTHYTRCFDLACRACFWCRRAEVTQEAAARERTLAVLAEICAYRPVLKERVARRSYSLEIKRLLDYKRFEKLEENILQHLSAVAFSE